LIPSGTCAHTFDFWGIAAPTDDPDHERAGYTGFKRSFGGQVKEYAGTWDLPIHAVKYSLYRASYALNPRRSSTAAGEMADTALAFVQRVLV
jgi:lipid II:glycine glycyltransferase (peptidoglycan interpeptide bridge formation enzyme)